MSSSRDQVTIVYSPIDAPEVEYSVEGSAVEDVANSLYDAWSLHGDIVVQPFAQGETTYRNVTQIFAQELNNSFDDVDATWEESGRIVIRGR